MQKFFESFVSDTDHRTYDESAFVVVEYVVQSDPALRQRVQTEAKNPRLYSYCRSRTHRYTAKAEAKVVQKRVRIDRASRLLV